MAAAWLGLSAARAAELPVAGTVAGNWDATVTIGTVAVPFRFGVADARGTVAGWFYNGDLKELSSHGEFHDGHLVLDFAQYAKRLDVTVQDDGSLQGTYGALPAKEPSKAQALIFSATRHAVPDAASVARDAKAAPRIDGLWIVPAQSRKKGEKAWRLIVQQSGANVGAAILRVDGDTGTLEGSWHDGRLELSHFDGARPTLADITAGTDGTLNLVLRDLRGGQDTALVGYRVKDAVAKGLPEAADPSNHTSVRDPNEVFAFSFPDLNGRTVSNLDPRFRRKVLVVDVSGSWCPNCHDEAPLLETLYRKYRARGLEVVSLSFEEAEELTTLTRLHAFIQHYGLDYTVLVAGTPDRAKELVPQAVDLDAFPTTFFIGRDGKVRFVHAGFAAPATGDFNNQLKRDFSSRIETLLAER